VNTLLARRQMVVDVIHPGKSNVPRKELQETIAKMYKSSADCVILFGARTQFGGGSSTMFCLVYNSKDMCIKFEPKYRLVRNGMAEKKESSRKQIKESKNRGKKVRGTGASIAKHKAKRAEQAD